MGRHAEKPEKMTSHKVGIRKTDGMGNRIDAHGRGYEKGLRHKKSFAQYPLMGSGSPFLEFSFQGPYGHSQCRGEVARFPWMLRMREEQHA